LLEPLEVQGPPVQVILRDTPEVVVVLNYVVPIDLLLVAWHVQIVWHIGLRGAGLGVPHNLLLEGLQSCLSHGHALDLTGFGLRSLKHFLLSQAIISVLVSLFHKLGHGRVAIRRILLSVRIVLFIFLCVFSIERLVLLEAGSSRRLLVICEGLLVGAPTTAHKHDGGVIFSNVSLRKTHASRRVVRTHGTFSDGGNCEDWVRLARLVWGVDRLVIFPI
jgi:hypothetical protein